MPLRTQRRRVGPKGEQIGFFKFPDEKEMKKRWNHAIRRDVGRFFRISRASKVCLFHFKLSDISKGLGGRTYRKTSAVPSIFAWKQLRRKSGSPPLKGLINNSEKTGNQFQKKECFSRSSEPEMLLGKTPEAVNDIFETDTNETIILGVASTSLNEMLAAEKILIRPSNKYGYLKKKSADLEKPVSELEDKNQARPSRETPLGPGKKRKDCCFRGLIFKKPATDKIHMDNRNHGLA